MATQANEDGNRAAKTDRVSMDKRLQIAGKDFIESEMLDRSLVTYATIMIMATNKPDPWGRGYIKLYVLTFVIFCTSTMIGFDGSLMGSINTLPGYTSYFGLPENGSASTGIVFAIFQVGQMTGALFVWITDWYGRTWHIFVGCLGACLATILTALSTNLEMFICGRFFISFFATFASTAVPLYLVELAPPAYRGTIAGMYHTFYYVGSTLATGSVYACHLYLADRPGNLDWRVPLWLQMVCPAVVCAVVKFYPESPRWLVMMDRHEEARGILAKYHTNGDLSHPLVDLEMSEILASVHTEEKQTWKDLFDLRVLVETRSSRYRLMLNVTFSWFSQFSGSNLIGYYLPLMLSGIGITDTNTKLIMNIVYAITGWVFSTIGARLHDIIGRRIMLMTSTAFMALSLAMIGGGAAGQAETGSHKAATLAIVFIFVFGATFSTAWTPMQPIYPAEVVSNKMRAKAMGTFKLTSGASAFVNTFATPTALKNIGYWFYIFFAIWDLLELVFIYFFFVETKGMTLEELDEVFEAKNPRKKSVELQKLQKQIIKQGKGKSEGNVNG